MSHWGEGKCKSIQISVTRVNDSAADKDFTGTSKEGGEEKLCFIRRRKSAPSVSAVNLRLGIWQLRPGMCPASGSPYALSPVPAGGSGICSRPGKPPVSPCVSSAVGQLYAGAWQCGTWPIQQGQLTTNLAFHPQVLEQLRCEFRPASDPLATEERSL